MTSLRRLLEFVFEPGFPRLPDVQGRHLCEFQTVGARIQALTTRTKITIPDRPSGCPWLNLHIAKLMLAKLLQKIKEINNVANDLLVFGIGEGGTVSQQNQNNESVWAKGEVRKQDFEKSVFERVSCSSLYKNKLFGNFGKMSNEGWIIALMTSWWHHNDVIIT